MATPRTTRDFFCTTPAPGHLVCDSGVNALRSRDTCRAVYVRQRGLKNYRGGGDARRRPQLSCFGSVHADIGRWLVGQRVV